MSSPSPVPPFPCHVVSSNQMFQWLNKHIYAGCAGDAQNPICQAVNAAASESEPTLSTLAHQLHKIKEDDMVKYLQGPGLVQAQVIGNTLLAFLKCYFSPSKDNKSTSKSEIQAMSKIKNWYIQNYLYYFGKASIPGVDFTRSDALKIRANIDNLMCKDSDITIKIIFYAIIVGVIMLVFGLLIGHHRGKTSCIKTLTKGNV